MGKRAFYERLIRGFINGDEARSVETARAQLAAGDDEGAQRSLHTLKGVAGNLGAVALQQRSQILETMISEGRDPSQFDACLTSVAEELDRMIDAMRQALSDAEDDTATHEPPAPDLDSVVDLPGLLDSLKDQTTRVAELQSTLTINEIEEFAAQMKDLGEHHRCQLLSHWSGELADAASMFDADQMAKLLSAFGNLHPQLMPD